MGNGTRRLRDASYPNGCVFLELPQGFENSFVRGKNVLLKPKSIAVVSPEVQGHF